MGCRTLVRKKTVTALIFVTALLITRETMMPLLSLHSQAELFQIPVSHITNHICVIPWMRVSVIMVQQEVGERL